MNRRTLSRFVALLALIALLLPAAAIPASAETISLNMESYTVGNINGQDGWSMTGAYDVAVVNNTYGFTAFGTKTLRISDAVTSGSFGDQTFAKPLVNAVGEATATAGAYSVGVRQNHFEMQFDIASTQLAQQPGMHVSVSPDRGDGARMSYLRFEDGAAGIDVFFDDVQQYAPCTPASCANFVETQVASGLSRATPHTIKLTMDTVDGPANDVVKVYIDGALVRTGTSWEGYYRYDPEAASEQSPRIVKTVLFRVSGAATPANAGKGYLIDNLTTSTADVATVIPVSNLQPAWDAPGGDGVYAAYYGPTAYAAVSPGATALVDGRQAGIIKAGLAIDPVDNVYEDEGLLAFKVPSVDIATFATQALTFDVENESGPNPVWVRIRLVGGIQYQFVPTSNPAGWHTVNAAAGQYQLMDSNGGATGPLMTLSQVAAANPGAQVDRVYLTLGQGNSYNVGPGVGTVGWVDKVTIGLKTYDFVIGSISPTTGDPLFCVGENSTIDVRLEGVSNLYGYQMEVNYDATKVSAVGAFDNAWFDTTIDASVPGGYNAACGGGVCKFAASKVAPGAPLTGSGRIGTIALTGLAAGTFDVTISGDVLSDRDGMAISHTNVTLPLTVCGYATVSGKISLQGRVTPIDEGVITLTDGGGNFAPKTATFSATDGAWSIANVEVLPTGSAYTLKADHGLYLFSTKPLPLTVGGTLVDQNTRLWGGDANNDETVTVGDLSCIGGAFGSGSVVCGTTGSSDINKDGVTNIQDLALAGGNYNKTSPQTW